MQETPEAIEIATNRRHQPAHLFTPNRSHRLSNAIAAIAVVLALVFLLAPFPSTAQNVRPPGQVTQERIDNAERRVESQGSSASTEMWRELRRGQPGISTAAGPEARILIQSQGSCASVIAVHQGRARPIYPNGTCSYLNPLCSSKVLTLPSSYFDTRK